MHPDLTRSSSLDETLTAELASLRARDLERRLRVVSNRRGAVVDSDSGPLVDFSSNDYLGLASDPRLAEAAVRATSAHGSGSAASRLIAGNTAEHDALDRDLAGFFGTECALSFSSGYAANTGTIPALVGRGDAIFADRLNHASLIDGCRLSRADVYVYDHADPSSLAVLLGAQRARHRRALVVTDGMFSMDGDLAPLSDLVALARAHDAWLYVDDAHAVGVLGAEGRGTCEQLGVIDDVDVLVGTLGKAFGAAGAFVAGSSALRDFLLNRARSFVFSTASMPAQAGAAREGVRIARDEPELRGRAIDNARALRECLVSRGVEIVGDAESHIVPVLVGDAGRTVEVGGAMADRGFLVGAVRPPTVPDGTSRLRITVSAAHTADHIASLADALVESLA